MFAQKPMQLKDGKCNSCGLDAHKGECVKKANQQRVHDEMAPAMQSLNRKLDKAGSNAEERERILKEFGKEMGRLVLTQGRGRIGARKGGRNTAGGNLRVTTANVPTSAAVAGAGKADKANADQKVTQMSPEDLKICKDDQVCRIHVTGGTCKFEGNCRWKHTGCLNCDMCGCESGLLGDWVDGTRLVDDSLRLDFHDMGKFLISGINGVRITEHPKSDVPHDVRTRVHTAV